jgi:hypothetical protein
MYIKYITYSLFIVIRPHVCGSWNITPKKWKNDAIPIYKISSFVTLIVQKKKKKKKKKKNTFLNEISSKNLKSLHGPRF